MGATSGAGTDCPSGATEFIPFFCEVHVTRFLVFCVVFWKSLFVFSVLYNDHEKKVGLVRESNPGPLAPEARIIPLDQRACQ